MLSVMSMVQLLEYAEDGDGGGGHKQDYFIELWDVGAKLARRHPQISRAAAMAIDEGATLRRRGSRPVQGPAQRVLPADQRRHPRARADTPQVRRKHSEHG